PSGRDAGPDELRLLAPLRDRWLPLRLLRRLGIRVSSGNRAVARHMGWHLSQSGGRPRLRHFVQRLLRKEQLRALFVQPERGRHAPLRSLPFQRLRLVHRQQCREHSLSLLDRPCSLPGDLTEWSAAPRCAGPSGPQSWAWRSSSALPLWPISRGSTTCCNASVAMARTDGASRVTCPRYVRRWRRFPDSPPGGIIYCRFPVWRCRCCRTGILQRFSTG